MTKSPENRRPVLRFAPSSNGYLHLGHAYSAVTTYQWAKRLGGQFKLRIEDIDSARCEPELARQIELDLAWLGLKWEGPVLLQSERFPLYKAAAEKLSRLGVLYPCFASRGEIRRAAQAHGLGRDPDGASRCVGLSKKLSKADVEKRIEAGERFSLRLDTERALEVYQSHSGGKALQFSELEENGSSAIVNADPMRWGDPIVVRKDVPASYHLAVVVDDAAQGVTHVTRGADLFAATDIHRLLQELLGLPEPFYHHHPLILGDDGRKLSKSEGAEPFQSMRSRGASPADVLAALEKAAKSPPLNLPK